MYKFMPNNSEANPKYPIRKKKKKNCGEDEPNTTAMSEERKKTAQRAR